jgi:hypothetical protein
MRWTTKSGCLLFAACLLVSCSSSSRNAMNAASASVQSVDPRSTLAALPRETTDEIELFSQSVTVPGSMPFSGNEEAGRAYAQWYRKGYAFAYVTGTECLRDHVSRDNQPEVDRARMLGWFDGNSAGGLARRLKEIDSAVGRVRSNRPNNP